VTTGVLNYLDESTDASLYRNGRVLIRRNLDGSDSGVVGVNARAHEVEVINARELTDARTMTCSRNGFELFACRRCAGLLQP